MKNLCQASGIQLTRSLLSTENRKESLGTASRSERAAVSGHHTMRGLEMVGLSQLDMEAIILHIGRQRRFGVKKHKFLGPGYIKGLCPVCKTIQALYLGKDGDIVSGPFYIVPHAPDGGELPDNPDADACDGSCRFVPDERKE